MAVCEVLKMGDARLLTPSAPVREFDTPQLHALIADLWETMAALDGAGLAAPQIGVNRQVVVFGFESNARYPEAEPVPRTVLVNPVLTLLGDEQEEGWEGCLSIPGMRGLVARHRRLIYRGHDAFGHVVERTVSGFHARVVQHETDHLQGLLYPMRMTDLRRFGFAETLFPVGTSAAR